MTTLARQRLLLLRNAHSLMCSPDIFCACNRLHVVWVHAKLHTAEVVDGQAKRYLPDRRYIEHSVRRGRRRVTALLCWNRKHPVPSLGHRTTPQPTSRVRLRVYLSQVAIGRTPVLDYAGHIVTSTRGFPLSTRFSDHPHTMYLSS
jgi:hypothetical protein